jgi:hypothetical protein
MPEIADSIVHLHERSRNQLARRDGLMSKGANTSETKPVTAAADQEDYLDRTPSTGVFVAAVMVVVSGILAVVLVELICYLFVPSIGASVYDWNHRILFIDGGNGTFQNEGDIFTYAPHSEIRSTVVYFYDHAYDIEYDYRFHANNYGLVQDFDVVPARPSILLLGDSFTEGQGAEPWFRQLAAKADTPPYQIINGGLFGTGFEQWGKLERYLSEEKKVQIRKLIVLFISDDYLRHSWNFSEPFLHCLQLDSFCNSGDGDFNRRPSSAELSARVDEIRAFRKPRTSLERLQQHARILLPATYRVYDYLRAKFNWDQHTARQNSRLAIANFIKVYGKDNVAFVHLPQKDEMMSGPNEIGMETRQSIRDAGGELYDGFKLCGLTGADYYIQDGHPNRQGYGKIANCVSAVLLRMEAQAK